MVFRKGAQLGLDLFPHFTSHPTRTRASVLQLFAGKPGLGSSILVEINTPEVAMFSSRNRLFHSAMKLVPTRASVRQQVSGIFQLRSSILAGNTAKIPVFSSLIQRRLAFVVYNMNWFFGCVAKKWFYRVDWHQVQRFLPPRRPTTWSKHLRFMALVGSGVLITLYFRRLETVPYSRRKHLVLMSRARERELGGSQLAEYILNDKIMPPNHPDSISVRRIFHNIVQTAQRVLTNEHNPRTGHKKSSTSHLEGINWEVLVEDSPTVNARCMLGGNILVYTEMLKQLKRDEGMLASLIAHEEMPANFVGHAVARHQAETLAEDCGLLLTGLMICLYTGMTYGLCAGMMSPFVYAIPTYLVCMASSRRMELEADYIGLLLLASAGYDPQLAIRLEERFGEILGDIPVPDILLTHPSCGKRARAMAQVDVMEEALVRYREAMRNRDRRNLPPQSLKDFLFSFLSEQLNRFL